MLLKKPMDHGGPVFKRNIFLFGISRAIVRNFQRRLLLRLSINTADGKADPIKGLIDLFLVLYRLLKPLSYSHQTRGRGRNCCCGLQSALPSSIPNLGNEINVD